MINQSESRGVTISRFCICTRQRRHLILIYDIFELIVAKPHEPRHCLMMYMDCHNKCMFARTNGMRQGALVIMWHEVCPHSYSKSAEWDTIALEQTLSSLLTGSVKLKVWARLILRFDNRPTCQSLKVLFIWLPCITGRYLRRQLVMTINIKHQRGWWQWVNTQECMTQSAVLYIFSKGAKYRLIICNKHQPWNITLPPQTSFAQWSLICGFKFFDQKIRYPTLEKLMSCPLQI